jgi:hypothetical protein
LIDFMMRKLAGKRLGNHDQIGHNLSIAQRPKSRLGFNRFVNHSPTIQLNSRIAKLRSIGVPEKQNREGNRKGGGRKAEGGKKRGTRNEE